MIDWKKVEKSYNRFLKTPGANGLSDVQTMYEYVLDLNKRLEKVERQQKNQIKIASKERRTHDAEVAELKRQIGKLKRR